MFEVLGLVLLLALILGGSAAANKRLADPNDSSVVLLDEVPVYSKLAGSGIFHVTIWRQSGNVHQAWEITGTASYAVAEVMRTFRRAKILAVTFKMNSESEVELWRTFHNHRGRAEGKRVGGATLKRVA